MLTALIAAVVLTSQVTAIKNVSVVDPTESVSVRVKTVVIKNGQFLRVDNRKPPEGAHIIDGRGLFLIPGLWDMHVHWYDEGSVGLFTANGVTGVRVMAGTDVHRRWRARLDDPGWNGPRIVTAGPLVDGRHPFWPGSLRVESAKDAEPTVETHRRERWDFMKTYSALTRESYAALLKEAGRRKLPVAGHVPYAVSLLDAARAGHQSNEHLDGFLLELRADGREIRDQINRALGDGKAPAEALSVLATMPIRPRPSDDEVRALGKELAKQGMWQCPTLVVSRSIARLNRPDHRADDRLRYLPASIRDQWDPQRDGRFRDNTDEDYVWLERDYQFKRSLIKPLREAGTLFLAGTDSLNPFCFPGFSLHDELELLVEAGLTPREALLAATVNPVRFLGLQGKTGRIRSGMWADGVLLSKNPLEKIGNTRSIVGVVRNGRYFSRPALDGLLSSAPQTAGPAESPSAPCTCGHLAGSR